MLYLQALLSRGVLLILEACGSLEILKPRLFVTSFPLTLECLYKDHIGDQTQHPHLDTKTELKNLILPFTSNY